MSSLDDPRLASLKSIKWARGEPPSLVKKATLSQPKQAGPSSSMPAPPPILPEASLASDRDYESITLMRMRQMAERQRIIEEMERQDADDQLWM